MQNKREGNKRDQRERRDKLEGRVMREIGRERSERDREGERRSGKVREEIQWEIGRTLKREIQRARIEEKEWRGEK